MIQNWYKLTKKNFVTFKTIPIWKERLNTEYEQTQNRKLFGQTFPS